MTYIQELGKQALLQAQQVGLTEAITVHLKTTNDAVAVDKPVAVAGFGPIDARFADGVELLPTDQMFRLPLSDIDFTPTRWSTITRADGTVYQVQDVRDGRQFWLLPSRQIG